MSRFLGIPAFLLVAIPAWAQTPVTPVEQPRLDSYGDPLPAGALRRLGTIRFRQDFVSDMAFAPDGKSLVVQGSGRVVQWDTATGKPLRTIPTSHSGNSRSLGLTRDGQLIAVRPDNDTVVVYEMSTGKELFRTKGGRQYPGGAISPDHSRLAIGASDRSSLWDLQSGKEIAELPGTEDLQFSPDGKWLVGRGRLADECFLRLYDGKTGRDCSANAIRNSRPGFGSTSGFGFLPKSDSLLVAWDDGFQIHDLKTQNDLKAQQVVRRIDAEGCLVAISPDDKILVTSMDRTVILTSIETGKEVRRWQANEKLLRCAHGAFSPDGKTLALPFECGIQMWDPNTGKRLDPYREPIYILMHAAVSNDAKTIACLYGSHTENVLRLIDTETLREKGRVETEPFLLQSNLAFSADGRRLAFTEWPLIDRSDHAPRVRLMDVPTGKEVFPEQKIVGSFSHWKGNDVLGVVESDHNRGKTGRYVDASNGKERQRTLIPEDLATPTLDPSFSDRRKGLMINPRGVVDPEGRWILAQWPSGNPIRPLVFSKADPDLRDTEMLGFSPDERLLAIKSGTEGIAFLETATGRERFRVKGEREQYYLRSTFSPDGRLIVVSRREGNHAILDSLTFEPLYDFATCISHPTCSAFSGDGRILATAEDASLLIWDVKALLRRRQTSSEKLSDARLGEMWSDLESEDAQLGHRAMVALSRRPDDAIAFLQARLPGPPPEEAAFRRLVRDLGGDDFKTREAAHGAIAKMGDAAGAMIRSTLRNSPSVEVKLRLTALADKLKLAERDRIRWARCAELLERIGSTEARDALERLRNISDPETADDAARSLGRRAALAR